MRTAITLVLGGVLFVACGGGGNPGSTLPNLVGIWSAQSGSNFLGVVQNSSLKALQLNPDGTGTAFATQADANVVTCFPLIYAVSSNNVLTLSSLASGVEADSVELYSFQLTNPTSLSITSRTGDSQTFSKIEAMPASSVCENANITARLENLGITGTSFANLLSDGTNLKLVDQNKVLQTINPTTGAISTPVTLPAGVGQYDDFIAMQGSSYWAHCGCGGSQDARRFDVPPSFTQLDSIDTLTDLSNQISVRAGAFEGSSLWLGGFSRVTNQYRLLQINSAVEPDTLTSSFDFPLQLQAITFLSSQMWGLSEFLGGKLIRVDPATRKASRTISLPPVSNGFYQGLTSLGGKLYVWVRNNNNTSSILAIQP